MDTRVQWDIGKKHADIEYRDFRKAVIVTQDALRYITDETFSLTVQFYHSTIQTASAAIMPESALFLEKENDRRMSGRISDVSEMNEQDWAAAEYVTADFRPSDYGPENYGGPVVQIEAKGRILDQMNFYARGGDIKYIIREQVCEAFPQWRVGDGQRSHHYHSMKCL